MVKGEVTPITVTRNNLMNRQKAPGYQDLEFPMLRRIMLRLFAMPSNIETRSYQVYLYVYVHDLLHSPKL